MMHVTFNDRLRTFSLNEYQKQVISLSFHKMHVVKVGLLIGGISLRRLLAHDMSKLAPIERINYSRYKYGIKSIDGWAAAWLHHLHHNPHHPEHWILSWRGDPDYYRGLGQGLASFVTVLPMPPTYVREFVIDMMATSKETQGHYDIAMWVNENGAAMNLHSDTEAMLDNILTELGYFLTDNCPWSYMAGDNTRKMLGL